MQINLHQSHHQIGDFEAIYRDLVESFSHPKTRGLHLFPELALCGYPLQDLCLQKSFWEPYLESLSKIEHWSQNLWVSESEVCLLIGGLQYEFDDDGLPRHIKNVAYSLRPGEKLEVIAVKQLLPNYDIFDEEKYFHPGTESHAIEFQGSTIGILICEDMWTSSLHPVDPVENLYQKYQNKLDLIVNLSASPYFVGKHEKRIARGKQISKIFGVPFAYVNRVGGEDEILFDGRSFIIEENERKVELKAFKNDIRSYEIKSTTKSNAEAFYSEKENTWESLFKARLVGQGLPKLPSLSDQDCEEICQALAFGIKEYTGKIGCRRLSVALSGGIDSSLVLAIARLYLPEEYDFEAIYMPGFYSAPESWEYSFELCQNLSVKLKSLPIKFFHSSIRNAYFDVFREDLEGLADENIQSRMRGALLYARSNHRNTLVLNTSNKSELAVGYSTLYGDSVGAISVLGDIYKTEVFELARYLNRKFPLIIPEGIISRPPSAELREDQRDDQSLPPYDRLDAILEGILSYRLSTKDLRKMGFDDEEIKLTYGLYQKSEYKRSQFAPIIKVRAKSFGFGYRIPITRKIFK